MKTHPIHVVRTRYRGTDKGKRAQALATNQDAWTLERHINDLLLRQNAPVQVYEWAEIARGCGLPYSTVAQLGYSIDGGSNGFTAWRHDLTYEEAIAAHHLIGNR